MSLTVAHQSAVPTAVSVSEPRDRQHTGAYRPFIGSAARALVALVTQHHEVDAWRVLVVFTAGMRLHTNVPLLLSQIVKD